MESLSESILDLYKQEIKGENLSKEELIERYETDKRQFDNEVDKIVGGYSHLDMDKFIQRMGGQDKIDEIKKINEKTDRLKVVSGKAVEIEKPQQTQETSNDLESWKKGFMEGYDEAYRRLHNNV